jgi:predicted ribonuclease YlaK
MATPNKEKRILKREPKLNVELNEEQKEFAALFYEKDVNFVMGDFGSGKSLVAVYLALTTFRKKMFNKIWITRPMLKNNLAALPGTLEEKMAPYIYPIVQNLQTCQGKELTEKMMKEGDIEIMPIEVAKGISFVDSCVIVDEWQDMDYQDFRTILTRLGKDSKVIFAGSKQQIDKAIGNSSALHKVEKLKDSGLVGWMELTSNHRNPILTDIIKYIEKND